MRVGRPGPLWRSEISAEGREGGREGGRECESRNGQELLPPHFPPLLTLLTLLTPLTLTHTPSSARTYQWKIRCPTDSWREGRANQSQFWPHVNMDVMRTVEARRGGGGKAPEG